MFKLVSDIHFLKYGQIFISKKINSMQEIVAEIDCELLCLFEEIQTRFENALLHNNLQLFWPSTSLSLALKSSEFKFYVKVNS